MKKEDQGKRGPWLAAVVMAALLAGAAPLRATDSAGSGFDPKEWLDGSPGLVKGIAEAETEARILVVYFYADWCGYCRQFEKELLGTPAFRSFVRDNVAVRINPEKGESESRQAAHYGVRGYPAFFVYGAGSKNLIRVERYSFANGRPEMLTPDQFIARIIAASAR